jgi:hypothetical protein
MGVFMHLSKGAVLELAGLRRTNDSEQILGYAQAARYRPMPRLPGTFSETHSMEGLREVLWRTYLKCDEDRLLARKTSPTTAPFTAPSGPPSVS